VYSFDVFPEFREPIEALPAQALPFYAKPVAFRS
jgi:hypothetical protein